MNNKYQAKAIELSNSQAGPSVCPTCGTPCAACEERDESNKPDERFNEVENRDVSELMEKGNMKKGNRFEEK